ncbi:hypothetical protein [Vulcanococcus sp.]|uniref:hypothetical protein n=1 Tax=Vulcanococcus sp. TaxID=2856995 RepID=UPI003C00584E
MPDASSLAPYLWVAVALVAWLLYPTDVELLPDWLRLRLQLWWINRRMQAFALWLWWKLPRPRPPFRYIPVQERKPPGMPKR